MKIQFIFVGVIAVALSGCLVTRSQVRERSQGSSRTETVAQLEKAETSSQLGDVEDTVRQLRGRVEETENNLNQMQMQYRESQGQRTRDNQAMDEKLKVYQEAIARLESQYLMQAQKIEALSAAKAAPAASTAKSGPQKGVFETADDYFDKKMWKQAAAEYDKYRKQYPKGRRYSNATFKIGHSFENLGMKDQAKLFYEEVVERYSSTSSAKQARERLKKLK